MLAYVSVAMEYVIVYTPEIGIVILDEPGCQMLSGTMLELLEKEAAA